MTYTENIESLRQERRSVLNKQITPVKPPKPEKKKEVPQHKIFIDGHRRKAKPKKKRKTR